MHDLVIRGGTVIDGSGSERPEAVYDLPTGGKRLVQRVSGYEHIVKRGEPIYQAGEHTGALPGVLFRGGR